ncbi:IclR family transcriptional regulator [Propionicimonas sp.]|uniref:IclR family transcriptional regulator n=1 Tax=Propionicimonas sp. TaxID=1955623 RepID=UPI0039E62009
MAGGSAARGRRSEKAGGEPAARRSVQSITRALEIIEALAATGRPIGITELAERVDLPLPTIHRILHTLIGPGYVFQTPRRHYALGARLISLSRYAGGTLGVTLRPYLSGVVEASGESASIAVLDQDFARYISHVPAEYPNRVTTEVGSLVSLHATGVGKAILASMPAAEARAIIQRSGLRPFTPNTVTDADRLLAELDTVRANGYALDREEHERGILCVAVPIPGPLRLAASVAGSPTRMTDQILSDVVLPALRSAVAEIAPVIDLAVSGQ